MVDSRYYTVQEAAEIFQVDEEQILRFIHSGELAAYNLAKQGAKRPTWRIAEADAAKLLMSRRSPGPQPAAPKASKRPQPKQYV